MRVRVDSCVWSLALRRKPNAVPSEDEKRMVTSLTEAIQKGSAALDTASPRSRQILRIYCPTAHVAKNLVQNPTKYICHRRATIPNLKSDSSGTTSRPQPISI